MSQSKGDSYFRTYFDSVEDGASSDSDDGYTLKQIATDIATRRDPNHARRKWLADNYEEIVELYELFIRDGQNVFGTTFFQHGGLHNFIEFTYRHTHGE